MEEVADSSQEFARELERQTEMEDETLDVGTTADEPASSSWVQAPSAEQRHQFVGSWQEALSADQPHQFLMELAEEIFSSGALSSA